jgi:hypothetical protein
MGATSSEEEFARRVAALERDVQTASGRYETLRRRKSQLSAIDWRPEAIVAGAGWFWTRRVGER